ncbi:MAG: Smr/MutS family protein [Verrucomicrobiota bacterium]
MMDDEPVEMPITSELDLHTFRPQEVGELLDAYLEACREKGILEVRIIHGKGTGTLRETVHAKLRKLDCVVGFRLGDQTSGSWGATLASLRPLE